MPVPHIIKQQIVAQSTEFQLFMHNFNKTFTTIIQSCSLLGLCLLISAGNLFAQGKQRTSPTTDRQNMHIEQEWIRETFNAHVSESGMYPGWLNRDGMLIREAFNTGVFNRWDTDEDGYISEDEYVAGSTAWEDDYTESFKTWDADEDGMLHAEEFGAGMDNTGLYDTWDVGGEGYLTAEEFSDGLFNMLEAGEDGYLTDGEFGSEGYDNWFYTDIDGKGTGTGTESGTGAGTGTGGGIDRLSLQDFPVNMAMLPEAAKLTFSGYHCQRILISGHLQNY